MKLAALALSLVMIVGCGRRHGLAGDAGTPPQDTSPGPADDGIATGEDSAGSAPPHADAGDAAELPPECDAGTDGGAWQLLGGPLASDKQQAFAPALALGDGDQPVVAWYEGTKIFTRAWTETSCVGAWRDLGEPVDGGFPTLASGAHGLMRAYLRTEGSQVVVERWNGSAFVALGAALDATQPLARASAPALISDADGNPVVAWDVDALHSNVQVARWTGTAWRALTDAQGVTGGIVYSNSYDLAPVSLALAADGALFVAWEGGARMTHVAKHGDGGGTTWTDLGSPLATYGKALAYSGPLVRVNHAGAVFVASLTPIAGMDAGHGAVFHLENDAWTPLDAGPSPWPAVGGQEFDLVLDGAATPLLVSVEPRFGSKGSGIFIYGRSGTSWEKLATGPVADLVSARSPHLAIDRRGRFVMTWSEPTNPVDGGVAGVIRVARTAAAPRP